jgi:plastocyanin
MRLPTVALLAATLLLATACGPGEIDADAGGTVIDGDHEPSASTTSTAGMPGMPGMPTGTPQADGAPVATDRIAISNFAYGPTTATVKVGTTVTWTNQDTDPHTVTSQNGGPLASPTLQKGDTYRFTFTAPGRFEYLCTIHPFMVAAVVVTP